ncbi:MAG TPA: SGNH/GDSL hydrolase family protein [Pseudonocardiaceae bacterium]|jgi:lysophospholipase L1-like esterase|nr:SGNH/GDSL hydrolase family protein [Pseudonocardiaceae bacterium]
MAGARLLRTTALTVGALGGLSSAAYGLLSEQSRRARRVIGIPESPPLNADGVYTPEHQSREVAPLRFAVLGDSSAAGLGVDTPEQLPGVLLARGLAEEAGRPVRLSTYAVSGSTTRDLAEQVDLAVADPPDLALLIIGANDVTVKLGVRTSARLLGEQVDRLHAAGIALVMGTCPDLGAIRPIPQPLRSIAGEWSRMLAKAQRAEVLRAGAVPVPLADLLSPEFFTRPAELFSKDRFHPNAAGYEAAAAVLLAPLCAAAGIWSAPVRPATVDQPRPAFSLIEGAGPVGLAT